MLKLMEKLEDNDDVQNVYSNFDIDEDVMEKLELVRQTAGSERGGNLRILGIDPGSSCDRLRRD